ncbi:hypothetical protein HIM_11669 [Hirsutella minnesotensis 3608]|uniref:Methyltransferase domain-containing protein n=1 Tax=Hirsutella minnesotensis 3608 TaxID=1043627 RepID=A0A0F7ZR38_9HYPO|nr:hypothetical protein HIM_11669 [Hirsutella minnesotensis 3608]
MSEAGSADSGFNEQPFDDNLSLRSVDQVFEWSHGRRYHSHSSGSYIYPNDEEEQRRLDLIHEAHLLLHGSLLLSSIDLAGRSILDIGTGTGRWAVDLADQNPSVTIVGLDLSPIQPEFVPPNVHFFVENVETEWSETEEYDFIHLRGMSGAIKDWQSLFHKIYRALKPGGVVEVHETLPAVFSKTQVLAPENPLVELMRDLVHAHTITGRPLDPVLTFRTSAEQAGFADISEVTFEAPLGDWPDDRQQKDIGKMLASSFKMGLHGLTSKAFRDVLGRSKAEVEVFNAFVRRELDHNTSELMLHIFVFTAQKTEQ